MEIITFLLFISDLKAVRAFSVLLAVAQHKYFGEFTNTYSVYFGPRLYYK